MKLIFGSVALKYWLPDLNRIPKDIDYIAKEGVSSRGAEVSYIFKVKKGAEISLFRIDGYYSSWDNNQWDDKAYEVEEYIKQVKDWRKI